MDIRKNIDDRFISLGLSDTIPDFEKHVAKFQEKHSSVIVTEFTYPLLRWHLRIRKPRR